MCKNVFVFLWGCLAVTFGRLWRALWVLGGGVRAALGWAQAATAIFAPVPCPSTRVIADPQGVGESLAVVFRRLWGALGVFDGGGT